MTDLASFMKRNLFSVFNERHRPKRLTALNGLWAKAGILWTSQGTFIGRDAIDDACSSLLRQFPEFTFQAESEVDEIPGVGRMRWSFGAEGAPPAIKGVDVMVVQDGEIISVFRFLDGAEL